MPQSPLVKPEFRFSVADCKQITVFAEEITTTEDLASRLCTIRRAWLHNVASTVAAARCLHAKGEASRATSDGYAMTAMVRMIGKYEHSVVVK